MMIHTGDCREILAGMADNSIDAICTDPPYELSFMGKKWDGTGIAFDPAMWAECLRVLKPGGHLIAFGATRTHHRIWCAVEDAGFQVRDTLQWLFGTGFPKSASPRKGMQKEIRSQRRRAQNGDRDAAHRLRTLDRNQRNYPTALGTALKPAYEPILLARKPLAGTVAGNVQEFGTGGLNVDACRLGERERKSYGLENATRSQGVATGKPSPAADFDHTKGRWPPNVLLSDDAAADLAEQNARAPRYFPTFKYQAKASRKEREAGCEGLPPMGGAEAVGRKEGSAGQGNARAGAGRTAKQVWNHHPTVKPVELMRWLVRLVTPPGGTVLDPFAGSGTTGVAAKLEGFGFVGIERNPEYVAIAKARIQNVKAEK